MARIGTTEGWTINLEEAANAGVAGWGWQDHGYGTGILGPLVKFAATGALTLRLQTREDGFRIDQILLSAERFLTTAPGRAQARRDDFALGRPVHRRIEETVGGLTTL